MQNKDFYTLLQKWYEMARRIIDDIFITYFMSGYWFRIY